MAVRLEEKSSQATRPGLLGLVRRETSAFWDWYERHYAINIAVATVLFGLQLIHLTWLGLDVIATRLVGQSYFPVSGIALGALLIVDLFEIPALVSVSLVYINELRKKRNLRSALYLFMLNSQLVHIFWITDEFVVGRLADTGRMWPMWLAWVAIGIDYLELPVMFDTTKRFVQAIAGRRSMREVFRGQVGGRRRPLVVVYCPGISFVRPELVTDTNGGRSLRAQPVTDEGAECCTDVAG